SLVGLSAAGASNGFNLAAIALFPALFAAGMILLDTIEGILMLGIYGWALTDPIRTACYTLTVTGLSAAAALIVAGIELSALIADKVQPSGWFWTLVGKMSNHFGELGLGSIGILAIVWIGAAAIDRYVGVRTARNSNGRTRPAP